MPIVPEARQLGLELRLHCDSCGQEYPGAGFVPSEFGDLHHLSEILEGLCGSPPPCANCGSELEVTHAAYRFDESDRPLVFVPGRGFELEGALIESEEDVLRALGRPFSLANYHRQRLLALAPGEQTIYLPAEGVVAAVQRIAPDATNAELAAQAKELVEEAVSKLRKRGDGKPNAIPIPWSALAGALSTWLGPAADQVATREIVAFTMVELDPLLEWVERRAPEHGLELEQRSDGSYWLCRGGLRLELELPEWAARVVSEPATLAEAAAQGLFEFERIYNASERALELARAEFGEPEMFDGLEARFPSGAVGHLAESARHCGYQPEQMLARLRDLHQLGETMASGAFEPGQARGCGCKPVLGILLRPREWAEREELILWRPFDEEGEIAACLVDDCPHFTLWLSEHSLGEAGDPEELWRRAEREHLRQQFELFLREVPTLEGRPQAVIAVGHNAGSLVYDERWLRALAARVSLRGGHLIATALSTALLVLTTEDADLALVRSEAQRLVRETEGASYADSQELVYSRAFKRSGQRGGRLELLVA